MNTVWISAYPHGVWKQGGKAVQKHTGRGTSWSRALWLKKAHQTRLGAAGSIEDAVDDHLHVNNVDGAAAIDISLTLIGRGECA